MTQIRHRRAFSFLEVFVVLGIIAMFLALLVPFALRMIDGRRTEQCVANLKRIGKGILAYTNDHENRLPGPLSTAQYPVEGAGNPVRDDQLLKHIARYLDAPAGSPDGASTAKTTFTCPTWQRAERVTDAPVFILNTDLVEPAGQPAWGTSEKPPLTLDQLKAWKTTAAGNEESVNLSEMWALADVDQGVTRILNTKEKWVSGIPRKPVHGSRRNALYFDWRVDRLTLLRTYVGPTSVAELEEDEN